MHFLYIVTVSTLLIFSNFSFGLDLSNSFSIGHDSNPMKLSESDINKYPDNLFLNKYEIKSSYLKLNTKLKFSRMVFRKLNRKTKFEASFKLNYYNDLKEKNNYGIYFKVDQPIGNYQYIKFNYSFIPDIYLRDYNDESFLYGQFYNQILPQSYNCYFNLERLTLKYESPYLINKTKMSMSLHRETQFYNKYFTEFDLEITGGSLAYFGKNKRGNHVFNISFSYSDADNISMHDNTPYKLMMDRGYRENSIKVSYEFKAKSFRLGVSLNEKNRDYSSILEDDKLHYKRVHLDQTTSLWSVFKINRLRHKVKLSYRKRDTDSPEKWVENLKTFTRIDFIYTIFFKKISLGKG